MSVSKRLLLLGIASFCLHGSNVSAAEHLTLKQVAQKAVLTNPEVLAKWHTFKAAGGDVDVARAGFFPRIDFSTGIGRETLKQPGITDRDYSRGGYTLTLNQMLYDGFATSSDVKRLDKARLTRYFELLDAAENAALEAGRAYYDVIRYRLLMFLAENNYVEHRSSYEQLLRRAQAGAGRRVDVEHAASRVALAELNLNTEAANLHDVMARYLRLVGERPPAVMFGPARLATDFPLGESEALKLAFKRNPALLASIENVESAHHDLEVRRSAFLPKLDLRMRSENSGNYQGAGGGRENNVAEIVLSYNLFNGGADTARKQVFAERKNLALDLRDKSCRDIRQTLSIAYNDVLRLRAQLTNLGLQVSSIEKTREAYKAQFNIGQRSLLDLLDTENELLNARRTEVNADVDLALAYLRTQAGIGRLLEFLDLKRIDEQEKPDASDMAVVVESEICPPEAPKSYLVDFEALNAKAMAALDLQKPESAESAAEIAIPVVPAIGSVGRVIAEKPAIAVPILPSSDQDQIIVDRIKAWAAAWSARSHADYASFYAPSFVPADGSSRNSWTKQREQRLASPSSIRVDVQKIRLTERKKDFVVTEFDQHYMSDRYSDRSLKTLQWVKVDGLWLIAREVSKTEAEGELRRREAEK
ncbi:MAG: TolC family outer membrane protein [Sulfuritalea sp.]|nr:TolC family outer membrane protein [Sulfuritalea sp.]MCF8184076.1 TolC family outer membrane protein [Polynucleobacter sp.]